MINRLNDTNTSEIMDQDSKAFENFFNDWCYRRALGLTTVDWGPDYWVMHGVFVKNSKLVYNSDNDKLLFLLRWS